MNETISEADLKTGAYLNTPVVVKKPIVCPVDPAEASQCDSCQ